MKKSVLGLLFAFCLYLGVSLPSSASYCNSPCPNPCAPSKTVCEGTNCTTYCSSGTYNSVYYSAPGVSFTYSTPSVSFSISNGFGPAYYYKRPPKNPPKPVIKPANNHKPAIKPAPLRPGGQQGRGPKKA